MTWQVLLLQLTVTLLTAAALVGWFTRSAHDPREVERWARSHGLEVTAINQAVITYYVRLTITLRVIGAVAGMVIGSLFDAALGVDTSAGLGFWTWIIVGWVSGSSWAAFRLTRAPASRHAASLTPRSLGDYLPTLLALAPLLAAAALVAMAGISLALGSPTEPRPGTSPVPRVLVMTAAVLAPLTAVLVTSAMRVVVARPQPARHPELLAADDAIRSSALHHLAAGATTALLLVAAQLSFAVLAPHQVPFGVHGWLPALLVAAAATAWVVGRPAWRVRRPLGEVMSS